MHFSSVSLIGLTAEALILISQIPQIYKSYTTHSTQDLSLLAILLIIGGILLWLLYGLLKPDLVIVIANVLSLVMFGAVLYAKLKFSKPH